MSLDDDIKKKEEEMRKNLLELRKEALDEKDMHLQAALRADERVKDIDRMSAELNRGRQVQSVGFF